MTDNRDRISHYYESRWGQPTRRASFTVFGHAMEVFKWPAAATGEGVTIYSTNGASAADPAPATGRRVEFFIGLQPEFDEIADSLSLLGSYPLMMGAVSAGDTVTLAEPLWVGSAIRTFLVAPQTEELLEPLLLPDGSHVHFCLVLPISEAELAMKKDQGAEWLLGELNDRGIPIWKHGRRYL